MGASAGRSILDNADQPRHKHPKTSIACQILDWADDCAYSIHDVEDALQAQFLNPGDLEDVRFRGAFSRIMKRRGRRKVVPELAFSEVRERLMDSGAEDSSRTNQGDERAHRKSAMRNILNDLITSVSVRSRRRQSSRGFLLALVVPDESRILSVLCKSVIWEAVITDPRVAAMSAKGQGNSPGPISSSYGRGSREKSAAPFPDGITGL